MSDQQEAVWIVDDDKEDGDLVSEIFKELNWSNRLELFETGEQLIERLNKFEQAPFIIISDINLPKMNGFELRERMLTQTNFKFHSVPFIFWSTSASEAQVHRAFQLQAHGFFLKENDYKKWKSLLIRIVDYWHSSLLPSKKEKVYQPF